MVTQSLREHADRIALAVKRLTAAYKRQPGEEVPVVESIVSASPHTYTERVHDLDKMLEHAVDFAAKMAALDNDWPPFIDTMCTVVMVPEAFGCEVVYPATEDMPWAKHAVYDISKVWDLKPKKPSDVFSIRRNAEWIDYAQRRMGTDLPIWTLDIQSPFSVAAQIVEPTELMTACITDPKAVHHVCRMVTDYWIEMMQEHLRQMEHPGFPGRIFPCISQNIGIVIADDTPLIMLSPEMYREFALPYNCEIGEAFGGVHLHSCGDFSHNIDSLLHITNLRSINFHPGPGEFPLPKTSTEDAAFNRVRTRLTYYVDCYGGVARGDLYKNRHRDFYAEYVLPRLAQGDMTGCILQSCCSARLELADLDEAIRWTRSQLVKG